MKNSTLFILLITSLSFFSCFDKKQEKYDIEILNAALKDKIKENDRAIRRFWVVVSGERLIFSREEEIIYQKAIDFQKLRSEILESVLQDSLPKNISEEYETLLRKITIMASNNNFNITKKGRSNLKKIDTQLKLYKQNENKNRIEKISWLFTCLKLELYYLYSSDFYESNNGVGGGGVFGTHSRAFFHDRFLKVKEDRKVVLLPFLLERNDYIDYCDFVFQRNGFDEKLSYQFENLEGLGILRFIPKKTGTYKVSGAFRLIVDKGGPKENCVWINPFHFAVKVE